MTDHCWVVLPPVIPFRIFTIYSLFVTLPFCLWPLFVDSVFVEKFWDRALKKTWSPPFTPSHPELSLINHSHLVQRLHFSPWTGILLTLCQPLLALCACISCAQMQCAVLHPTQFPSDVLTWSFLSNALSPFRFCNENSPCPLPIFWSSWGPWNKCSVNCGGGIHSRQRSCENGNTCPGCAVVCIISWHCMRGTYWHRGMGYLASLSIAVLFLKQEENGVLSFLLQRMLKGTWKQRGGRFREQLVYRVLP